MRIKITESQLKALVEQSNHLDEQTLLGAGLSLLPISTKIATKYPHEFAMVAGIASAFIPIVGPFISAGIGLADASLYYKEGDTKTAGMVAMFSLMPGVGNIIAKIPGVKQLGAKGMSALAAKISKGTKITDPVEIAVVNGINQNKELVKSGINDHVKVLSQQAAAKTTNQNIKGALVSIAKNGITYGGAGIGYSSTFDYMNRKEEEQNIAKLNQMLGIK